MRQKKIPPLPHSRSKGYTLIEIMITLVIIAIVATVAAPALLSMVPNMRLKAAGRDVYSLLQNTKMLAIKENRNVNVRFDTNGMAYQDEDGNGAYTAGEPRVLLGEDLNNNNTLDAGEDLNGNGILDINSGVQYGTGGTANDWSAPPVACVQATSISFNPRGIPTIIPAGAGVAVYLENENNTDCFAADVGTAGSIKLHRYNGTAWD